MQPEKRIQPPVQKAGSWGRVVRVSELGRTSILHGRGAADTGSFASSCEMDQARLQIHAATASGEGRKMRGQHTDYGRLLITGYAHMSPADSPGAKVPTFSCPARPRSCGRMIFPYQESYYSVPPYTSSAAKELRVMYLGIYAYTRIAGARNSNGGGPVVDCRLLISTIRNVLPPGLPLGAYVAAGDSYSPCTRVDITLPQFGRARQGQIVGSTIVSPVGSDLCVPEPQVL